MQIQNYTPKHIKKELSKFEISDFTNLTHRDLILKLLNIQSKLIAIKKYKVFISNKVKTKLKDLDENTKKSYEDIVRTLSRGTDINPFLSKKCIDADFYDKLFLDWEIKHIHINSKVTNGYFNERADLLLIVTVQENNIYFIDIAKHKKENKDTYNDIKYLKILHTHWKHLFKAFETGDICDDTDNPSNEDIKYCRENNFNVPICLDGKLYLNHNNGISGIGTTFNHVDAANKIIKEYKKMKDKS